MTPLINSKVLSFDNASNFFLNTIFRSYLKKKLLALSTDLELEFLDIITVVIRYLELEFRIQRHLLPNIIPLLNLHVCLVKIYHFFCSCHPG